MGRDLVDAVTAAIRQVSTEVIEPRFGALRSGEVRAKSPGEMVTVADEQAEALLAARLGQILPGVPVVGEEACSRRPALVSALASDRAWLVDPLDGTANFVAGNPDWAVMVALVEAGATRLSWIWQPAGARMYVAESGGGATCNGEAFTVAARRGGRPDGAVLRRFLEPPVLERLAGAEVRDRLGRLGPGRYCAGVEYPLVIDGSQDFALFWRTLPWDHAPGVLLLEEAGGVARRPDGTRYHPADQMGRGLVASCDEKVFLSVRDAVFG